MIDRRRGPRRRLRARVLADLNSRVVEGVLLDVGETGAWLAMSNSVAAGSQIRLTFEHPDTHETVSAGGIVSRCVRLGIPITPPYGLGVQFDQPLSSLLNERSPRAGVERVPLMLRGADGLSERGVLVNVSGTGLLVMSRTGRQPDERVELELVPDDESGCPRARLSATVQWVQGENSSGFVAAGLRVEDFPTMDERIAFATWVAERISREA
jgi:hypothetical protein